jgi:hypothetical protein
MIVNKESRLNCKDKFKLIPESEEEIEFIKKLLFTLCQDNVGSIRIGSENIIEDFLEVFVND